jgi:hypothetical protein
MSVFFQGGDDENASGQFDSGWVGQGNGTYVRRKSSWSRKQQAESSVGGVQLKPEDLDELSQHYASGQVIHGGADLNAIDVDGHAVEAGDHGRNSTGLVLFNLVDIKIIFY